VVCFPDHREGTARIAPGITRASPLDLYDFPISHSLIVDFVWAGLFAGTYLVLQQYLQEACVLRLAVLSHWVLDWLSHRPDMPLAPGTQSKYGLGIRNSIPLTYAVEGGLGLVGIAVYVHVTRATDHMAVYAFWPVIALLTAIWTGSIGGASPQHIRVVAVGNLMVSAVFAWAYWIDRHRPARL